VCCSLLQLAWPPRVQTSATSCPYLRFECELLFIPWLPIYSGNFSDLQSGQLPVSGAVRLVERRSRREPDWRNLSNSEVLFHVVDRTQIVVASGAFYTAANFAS
jgi:hypothetical protein